MGGKVVLVLRFTLLILAICSLLVTAGIVSGQMSESTLLVSSEEVYGKRYLFYIEDLSTGVRIDMAGRHCAEPSPQGIYANLDADPPILAYPSRRITIYTNDLREALADCHPLSSASMSD